jgi:predicted dienelactone hydrolase
MEQFMRLFENLILLTLILALAWSFLPRHRRSRLILYMPFFSAALIVVHFLVEGYRWQMIPAYLLAAFLLAKNVILLQEGEAARQPVPTRRPLLRYAIVLLVLVLFLLLSQLPALLPVFNLPVPDGPYAIGTTGQTFIDPARAEYFTSDPDDRRQVPVQVWYPAETPTEQRPVGYWLGRPQMIRMLTRELGLPFFTLDHLELVKTNTYEYVPLAAAQESYPVVIFSHGYRLGYLQQNTSLMETLASHGYIVFSVAHPYQAIAVPLADGSLARFATENRQRFSEDPEFRQQSLRTWVEDMRFVIDGLDNGQIFPQFQNKLNMAQLGIAGMSFGGSAASLLCLEDARCQAGLTLDSPQYEPVLSTALQQPFLFFSAEESLYVQRSVYEAVTAPAYLITINESTHNDFIDLALVSPLGSLVGFSGMIRGEQMLTILNAYSLAFFDRHLRELPRPLLNGPTPDFPEVKLEFRNTP